MAKKRAIITGISGFVGTHLARELLRQSWEVHGIDLHAPTPDLSVTLHPDRSTPGLITTLKTVRPDVVFHLATRFVAHHQTADVEPLIESNVTFGAQLLEAMKCTGGGNLVVTGTAWQHFESKPYHPVSLYAATKQLFQDLLVYYTQCENVRATVVKLFDTFGPNDTRPKFFHWLRQSAFHGMKLEFSPGDQLMDLVYIDDVISALLTAERRLSERKDSGLVETSSGYAVSSGQFLSLQEIVKIYAEAVGRPLNIVFGAKPYRPREMMTPWKASPLLPEWKPSFSLQEGIIQMERQNGLL